MRITAVSRTYTNKSFKYNSFTTHRIKLQSDLISKSMTNAVKSAYFINKNEITEQSIINKLKQIGYKESNNDFLEREIFPKHLKDLYNEMYDKWQETRLKNDTILKKNDIKNFKDFIFINPVLGKKLYNENFEHLLKTFCTLKINAKLHKLTDENLFKMISNILLNEPDKQTQINIYNYKGKVYEEGIAKNAQKYLRDKANDSKLPQNATLEKYVENISSYINKQSLNEGTKLYRGERFYILENAKLLNGESINLANIIQNARKNNDTQALKDVINFIESNEITVIQPGFMSTSIFKDPDFERNGWIHWELTTELNTKGVYLEGINSSFYAFQDEVLLQKNSKIKIQNARFDDDKNILYLKGQVSN